MSLLLRWGRCLQYRGAKAERFIHEYFKTGERQILLIAGAGFDPRACDFPERLAAGGASRIRVLLLREERKNESRVLRERAERNLERLTRVLPGAKTAELELFAFDGAAIGGRKAVELVAGSLDPAVTDVIVDVSAMSLGVAFPIVRYLVERAAATPVRTPYIHVAVSDEPWTDSAGMLFDF